MTIPPTVSLTRRSSLLFVVLFLLLSSLIADCSASANGYPHFSNSTLFAQAFPSTPSLPSVPVAFESVAADPEECLNRSARIAKNFDLLEGDRAPTLNTYVVQVSDMPIAIWGVYATEPIDVAGLEFQLDLSNIYTRQKKGAMAAAAGDSSNEPEAKAFLLDNRKTRVFRNPSYQKQEPPASVTSDADKKGGERQPKQKMEKTTKANGWWDSLRSTFSSSNSESKRGVSASSAEVKTLPFIFQLSPTLPVSSSSPFLFFNCQLLRVSGGSDDESSIVSIVKHTITMTVNLLVATSTFPLCGQGAASSDCVSSPFAGSYTPLFSANMSKCHLAEEHAYLLTLQCFDSLIVTFDSITVNAVTDFLLTVISLAQLIRNAKVSSFAEWSAKRLLLMLLLLQSLCGFILNVLQASFPINVYFPFAITNAENALQSTKTLLYFFTNVCFGYQVRRCLKAIR